MKNIFEIMKEYGIDMPEDKKKDFEKSVLENYKTVADYNKQVESLNKANDTIKANDTAMKELQGKLDAFKDVDVTELNNTITKLKEENTRIENEYKDKEAQRNFDDLVKEAITSAHGKNTKAITALLDTDTLMKSKNQKEDIAAALKTLSEAEDSKMLFGEAEKDMGTHIDNPIGGFGSGGNTSTASNQMRSIMGLPPVKGE